MIVFDSDDFGCNHVISDMCQSHDCRDMLMLFKEANPNFKATLFTIPGYVTTEILGWANANRSWIELAWHGFYHLSNYECEKVTYEEFGKHMRGFEMIYGDFFTKGFKAPGWQISDDIFRWLKDHGYWVADQAYNDERRPKELPAYVNNNGLFNVRYNDTISENITPIHTHTWNTVGNGVYELHDSIIEQIRGETEFGFVSEIINEAIATEPREIRPSG
jgi:peptidoglycan/xylan/chitin deacetylase (PgdA/CDA1 family)